MPESQHQGTQRNLTSQEVGLRCIEDWSFLSIAPGWRCNCQRNGFPQTPMCASSVIDLAIRKNSARVKAGLRFFCIRARRGISKFF